MWATRWHELARSTAMPETWLCDGGLRQFTGRDCGLQQERTVVMPSCRVTPSRRRIRLSRFSD